MKAEFARLWGIPNDMCARSSNIIHECQILSFCLDKRELETLAKFESLLAQRRWYNIQSWYTYFVSHLFRMSYRINSRQWAYFFFLKFNSIHRLRREDYGGDCNERQERQWLNCVPYRIIHAGWLLFPSTVSFFAKLNISANIIWLEWICVRIECLSSRWYGDGSDYL